ncbi:MAG TPA: hypothetical protein VF710_18305, partial [Longimicrobium sp.]
RHIESREAVPPEKVFLEAELVVRDSTRSLTAAAAERPVRVRVAGGEADGARRTLSPASR